MRCCRLILLAVVCLAFSATPAQSQDSVSLQSKILNAPDKLFNSIQSRSQKLERQLERQTEKYLERLAKKEKRLKEKLWKKDSVAAKQLFGDIDNNYSQLQSAASQQAGRFSNVYSGHMDSMKTALNFLQQNNLINQSAQASAQMQSALGGYAELQGKLNQAENIKKYLKARQQLLKEQMEKFGLVKEFRKFQKEAYYYKQQVNEYKQLLEDPSKLEAKLLHIANAIPAFRKFFSQHSELGRLFRLPGNDEPTALIAGLQTRASVQQDLLQRFGSGAGVRDAMQQGMGAAQAEMNELKNKFRSSGDDSDIPGFKPNNQKTKSFWQRIEFGTNVQSVKGSNFFPVTSDFALTAGYKLNDKSIAGIGASYKLGWGQNIRNIRITHEGVGFRSFLDWKLKGSLYASGGFEYNYQQPFDGITQLYTIDNWKKSGLLGVSKIVSVQNKFFKKTKVQLLWDFLSYGQVPRTQPLKFRVGYSFN